MENKKQDSFMLLPVICFTHNTPNDMSNEDDITNTDLQRDATVFNRWRGGANNRNVQAPAYQPSMTTMLWIGLAVLGVNIIITGGAIFMFTRETGNTAGYYAPGTDCNVVTCSGAPGPSGPSGRQGPPGADGAQGPTGNSGPQGNDGQPGPSGPASMCLNDNPACLQGPTGPTGPSGPSGGTGPRGFQGGTGPTGGTGPQGASGISITGPTGGTGPKGDDGAPGVCDCLGLGAATYDTVNVTNTLTIPSNASVTLAGTLNCLAPLPPACFGLSVCPNFTLCDLEANSLSVEQTIMGRGLVITDNSVIFKSPAPYISTFRFGDSSVATDRMQDFFAYATNLKLDGRTDAFVRSLDGTLYLRAGGNVSTNNVQIDSISGQVILQSQSAMSLTSLGSSITASAGGSVLTMGVAGSTTLTTTNATVNSGNILLRDTTNSLNWLKSNPLQTFTCPGPLTGTLIPQASVSNGYDLIGTNVDLALSSTSSLFSLRTDGLIRTGGFNFFCNALLKTESGFPIQIHENPSEVLDIRGIISNNFGGGAPVVFIDGDGVDFQGTNIFDSTSIPLTVSDTQGLRVSTTGASAGSTSVLYTNFIESVNVAENLGITAPLTIINGNLRVDGNIETINSGNIFASGMVSAGGACCTSDKRVKQNIQTVEPYQDLKSVLDMPRRVSFQYTEAYANLDKSVNHNTTYEGYIAQELEESFPALVHTRDVLKLPGGDKLEQFKSISYQHMVPYLVGAIQALHQEMQILQREIQQLKQEEKK